MNDNRLIVLNGHRELAFEGGNLGFGVRVLVIVIEANLTDRKYLR